MNKLVVLSGLPGSGKSYLTSLFAQKMKQGHLYVVSSDATRKLVGGSQTNFDNEALIWDMYYKLVKVYSLDKSGVVICDSTNIKREHRITPIKDIANDFDEVYLVYFKLDRDLVFKQNVDREFPVPMEAMERMINEYEEPNEIDDDFFDHIYTISRLDESLNVINSILENK